MSQDEFKEIMLEIKVNFKERYTVEEFNLLAKSWWKKLKDIDVTLVQDNLTNHLLNSNFPPRLADLVKGHSKETKSVVPGVEETQAYIDGIKQLETQGIGRERAQVYIDKIRAMLEEM